MFCCLFSLLITYFHSFSRQKYMRRSTGEVNCSDFPNVESKSSKFPNPSSEGLGELGSKIFGDEGRNCHLASPSGLGMYFCLEKLWK